MDLKEFKKKLMKSRRFRFWYYFDKTNPLRWIEEWKIRRKITVAKKLTKNQALVLKALRNPDNWRSPLRLIKKETSIKNNTSVLRAIKSLRKKGLIGINRRPKKKI